MLRSKNRFSANPRTTWCGHHCHPYFLLPETTQHIPQLPSCNRGAEFEGQLAVSNSSDHLLLSPGTGTLNRTGLVGADRAKRNKSHGKKRLLPDHDTSLRQLGAGNIPMFDTCREKQQYENKEVTSHSSSCTELSVSG